jgi:hypothetical protein
MQRTKSKYFALPALINADVMNSFNNSTNNTTATQILAVALPHSQKTPQS